MKKGSSMPLPHIRQNHIGGQYRPFIWHPVILASILWTEKFLPLETISFTINSLNQEQSEHKAKTKATNETTETELAKFLVAENNTTHTRIVVFCFIDSETHGVMVSVNPNPPPQGFYFIDPMNMSLPALNPPPPPPVTAAGVNTASFQEDLNKKIRKPYTITKSRESWSEQEHDKFLEALQLWVFVFVVVVLLVKWSFWS